MMKRRVIVECGTGCSKEGIDVVIGHIVEDINIFDERHLLHIRFYRSLKSAIKSFRETWKYSK